MHDPELRVSEVPGRPSSTDVLFVLDSFNLGGTETFAARAVELLASAGVRVHVLGLRPEGPLRPRFEASADRVHDVSPPSRLPRSLGLAWGIRRIVQRLQPRVVYAQDVFSNYLAAAALIGNRRTRFVSSWRWTTVNGKNRRRLAAWAARRSTRVVTNSSGLVADVRLLGVPLSRVSVVPNIIEAAMLTRATNIERRQWRTQLKIAPDDRVVMFAGRLNPLKGPDIAIRTLAQLDERARTGWRWRHARRARAPSW